MGDLLVTMTRSFNVYHNGRNIDTIFYNNGDAITADDVKRSLINHDYYPADIIVREVH